MLRLSLARVLLTPLIRVNWVSNYSEQVPKVKPELIISANGSLKCIGMIVMVIFTIHINWIMIGVLSGTPCLTGDTKNAT
jgi:hypothetical protein